MAYPTVKFNSSTGSDTQASGAGPTTALFGTNASFAGSVWTLDGSPDLSGVAVDGSHVIWANTTTGRQFFNITAKDNALKTVTVADAPAGTATGRTWGIGGKRQTLNAASSRTLFAVTVGAKAGWIIDIEAAADYVLTTELDISFLGSIADGPIRIYSSSGTKPVITSSTSGIHLFDVGTAQAVNFQNLKFTHSGATRGHGITSWASMTQFCWFDNLEFDGCQVGIRGSYGSDWTFQNCSFTRIVSKNCTSHGIEIAGEGNILSGLYVHHNAGSGIYGTGGSNIGTHAIVNALITNNTGRGIYWNSTENNIHGVSIVNCTIANNGSDGIRNIMGTGFNTRYTHLVNTILYGNLGWGVYVDNPLLVLSGNNNAYGANSLGHRNGFSALPGDVDLTANPFTAALDYTLNNIAGGGAACRGAGFPGTIDGLVGGFSVGAMQLGTGGGGSPTTRSYGA
jgi:hypothetical protein